MPDAGRTRGPCVQRKCALCARKQRQGSRDNPAFPAQWFDGLYVISSVRRAVWPPSLSRTSCEKLDPSVGGSGPHDFAVRKDAFVGA